MIFVFVKVSILGRGVSSMEFTSTNKSEKTKSEKDKIAEEPTTMYSTHQRKISSLESKCFS